MRLIDADELKQAETRISNLPWGDWHGNKVKFTWMPHEVQRLIDRAPTIDAVEVVRCEDCKKQSYCHETVAKIKRQDGSVLYWTEPIEWCSKGERREDGEV